MASNYVSDHSSEHSVENGCFVISYLRRTPTEPSAHVPSWEKFIRDDVLYMTMKLVNKGRQNSDANWTLTCDSGLNNGLAIELQITGIEVPEDGKKNYLRRMKQFLKKMSKTIHVDVQTARVVSSRVQRQERGQVSEIQNETPSRGICCKAEPFLENMFGNVAIVPDDVTLVQDNRILDVYAGDGSIPSAFLLNTFIPLSCITPPISIFVPRRSFRPYLIPWSRLPTNEVYLMVATPDFAGCVTGLLPFLLESDVANFSLGVQFQKVRINPPLVNVRAPLAPPGPLVNLRAPLAAPRSLVNLRAPLASSRRLVNLRAPLGSTGFWARRDVSASWAANGSDFPTL